MLLSIANQDSPTMQKGRRTGRGRKDDFFFLPEFPLALESRHGRRGSFATFPSRLENWKQGGSSSGFSPMLLFFPLGGEENGQKAGLLDAGSSDNQKICVPHRSAILLPAEELPLHCGLGGGIRHEGLLCMCSLW